VYLLLPMSLRLMAEKNGKKNRVNPTLTRPDPVLPPISADPTRPVFSGLSFLAAPTRPVFSGLSFSAAPTRPVFSGLMRKKDGRGPTRPWWSPWSLSPI
jgi:hypothetical protein